MEKTNKSKIQKELNRDEGANNMTEQHTYTKDGRAALTQLYSRYNKLLNDGWKRRTICTQGRGFPIYAYTSPKDKKAKPKPSFWILSGIHGEEPAGPNALAQSIEKIAQLAKNGIPTVFLPMLNPKAYHADDRYFDAHRGTGSSVTDAEYLLRDSGKPNKYSAKILNYIIKLTKSYPPLLVMDHHEDALVEGENRIDSKCSYGYCSGEAKLLEPLCKQITSQLIKSGFPIQKEGITRFGEKIHHGFVINSSDGSVDELLSSLGAKATFTIETTRDDAVPIPLKKRVDAQKTIIDKYPSLWCNVNI